MEEKINTLQEMINQRAEKRLNEDLHQLAGQVLGHPLMKSPGSGTLPKLAIFKSQNEQPEWDTIYRLFGSEKGNYGTYPNNYGTYLQKLWELWLPIYTRQETVAFLNSVDEMKGQLNDLADETENLRTQINR